MRQDWARQILNSLLIFSCGNSKVCALHNLGVINVMFLRGRNMTKVVRT